MTEDMGYFVGGITGMLAAIAAWVVLFLWYFQGETAFELFFLIFNPLTYVFWIVVTVTVLAASLGGSTLGGALTRHLKERD